MKSVVLKFTLIIIGLVIIHGIVVKLGFYERKIPVDIPQHILGGVMLGLFAVELLKYAKNSSKFISIYLILLTAVFGSFIWEIVEFSFLQFFPNFAATYYLYSSTASDMLSDIAFGFLGGLITVVMFYTRGTRLRTKTWFNS